MRFILSPQSSASCGEAMLAGLQSVRKKVSWTGVFLQVPVPCRHCPFKGCELWYRRGWSPYSRKADIVASGHLWTLSADSIFAVLASLTGF